MFDIGFSEIVVIAVVALVVIGPEKLPKTARTLGHLFGRLQRYVNEVKADISREIELDELRKMQQQVQTAAKDIETSFTHAAQEAESSLRAVESDLNSAATPPAPAGAEMLPLGAGAADAAASAAVTATPPSASPAPSSGAATSAPASPPASSGSPSLAPQPPATPDAAEASRQPSLPGFERG
jgi:sec-independent protein translocase protein TatB